MTDKQIIIDGYDVSLCEHFCKDDPCKNTCHYFCTPCEWVQIQNCMYKYGKRKEQECEELKSAFVRAECQIADDEILQCDMREAIEELKAENDELKKIIERLDVPKHEVIDMDIALENNKLKQTLTEVKELLLKTPTDSQAHFINAKSVILQKISEMKDV